MTFYRSCTSLERNIQVCTRTSKQAKKTKMCHFCACFETCVEMKAQYLLDLPLKGKWAYMPFVKVSYLRWQPSFRRPVPSLIT